MWTINISIKVGKMSPIPVIHVIKRGVLALSQVCSLTFFFLYWGNYLLGRKKSRSFWLTTVEKMTCPRSVRRQRKSVLHLTPSECVEKVSDCGNDLRLWRGFCHRFENTNRSCNGRSDKGKSRWRFLNNNFKNCTIRGYKWRGTQPLVSERDITLNEIKTRPPCFLS